MNTLENSSLVLRDAISHGLIDTTIYPFGSKEVTDCIAYLSKGGSPSYQDPHNPNTFELSTHARSERWQEHYFPPTGQIDFTHYSIVECCRICVPKGDIGILRTIDQVLFDAESNYYPTQAEYWGNPYNLMNDVAQVRWYLQLDYFNGLQPPQYYLSVPVVLTQASLPGWPYQELPEIQGLWYPCHCGANRVKMLIPGNRMLRLFMLTGPTTTYRWFANGRFRALLQSTYCREAEENARLTF